MDNNCWKGRNGSGVWAGMSRQVEWAVSEPITDGLIIFELLGMAGE
jgi:hypothetical protein